MGFERNFLEFSIGKSLLSHYCVLNFGFSLSKFQIGSRSGVPQRQVRSFRSGLPVTSGVHMPEVIFNGPAGRLEGRYQPSKEKNAPIAL
ncbi:hypothetical protein KWI13_24735, partial [Enterobacter cloacae]